VVVLKTTKTKLRVVSAFGISVVSVFQAVISALETEIVVALAFLSNSGFVFA